jgi:P-type Ca2+ transporter type 2C
MRKLSDVIQQLSADPAAGLSDSAVAASQQQFGKNVLTPLPKEPVWKKFLEKFDEPIIKILLSAALLSMIVDLFQHVGAWIGGISFGVVATVILLTYLFRQRQWAPSVMFALAFVLFFVGLAEQHVLVEGLAVMIAIFLATGVAFASEYKSDREFEVLNTRKESIKVKVLRGGQLRSVTVEDVVVGDVVQLETGDEIPADGRVIKATEVLVDQSLMTGESEPVGKSARPLDDASDGPDQEGCVYRGTQIVDGAAHIVVAEVGDSTYLGQIARRLSSNADDTDGTEAERVKRKLTISKELTPLQQKLERLADVISKVGYVAAVAIFLAQLGRGLWAGEVYWPQDGTQTLAVARELLSYFVTMVIVIVVAVPEGLPMSVTVSLALAMSKMTRANSLVRQLVACETIGSATVICSDKTGTMTQNKMRVDRVSWKDQAIDRHDAAWSLPSKSMNEPRTASEWMALNSAVNSTAHLEEKKGKTITVGNSTEGALLHWLREAEIDYAEVRSRHHAEHQLLFSSERKRMTTVVRHSDAYVALVKGAPEVLIDSCKEYVDADGSTRTLNAELKDAIQKKLQESAAKSMRTLAFAYALVNNARDAHDDNLIYIGFVGIRDPLRDDVKDAIDECRRAGIDVKMITGDNAETARAIGYEVGLIARPDEPIDVPNATVLSSQRLAQLTDDEVKQHLPALHIVARAKPLDKYRLVRLLQELGEVVAVTGDGTNDAPALKKADVGLAMGISGTEVAKEASKIVLLDDSFATIVKAVQWGRSLYENIQRFIQFQLTINVSALLITFLGVVLFGVRAPFTVLQLLWINVIMDTFASIALCSEPPRASVMKQPPKRRDDNILTRPMLRSIFVTAAFFVVVMLALLVAMKYGFLANGEVPLENEDYTLRQVSLFFSIYVFFQVWNQINARSLTPERSGFYRITKNPLFLAIAAAVALGQIAIVTFGGRVFKVEPLSVWDWLAIILFTSSVLVFAEITRRLSSRLRRDRRTNAKRQTETIDVRHERTT